MAQMKPNMMGAQMQRDGSQMDMNGQRAPSPNSNENAPSPNKRPRVEGKSHPPNSVVFHALTLQAPWATTCPTRSSMNSDSPPIMRSKTKACRYTLKAWSNSTE